MAQTHGYLVYTAVIPIQDKDRTRDSYFNKVPYNSNEAFVELPANASADKISGVLTEAAEAHAKKMKADGLPGKEAW